MSSIITIICVILVFGIVILVHEFGHFATAKLFGVKVHEFAIGMGPALLKHQKGETLYSLRAFPMGGYVKMEGEDEESEDERAFGNKKPYMRFIILAAGAFMNFVLGFLLLVILISCDKSAAIGSNIVESVPENYHSYEAGLKEGDVIVNVNGSKVRIQSDIAYSLSNEGDNDVTVKRGNEKIKLKIPLTEIDGQHYLGVVTKRLDKTPVNVIKYSYCQMFTVIKLTYKSFFDMFKGKVKVDQMSGPVGIITEINSAAKRGFFDVLSLLILITLNLGVVNLFPLPALDGGRLVFVLYEMITRKKVKTEFEAVIHLVGFAVLILFILYITKNDIIKLFVRGG